MENDRFKKLEKLIEALTHSGCDVLNEEIFKEVKKICKSSQDNVLYTYNLVLAELKKNNSQIRLTAFQICKEFFKRSGLFRENVIRDLQIIFDLTTGINSSEKLPPPNSSAKNLKCLVISTLKEWVEEFGATYKKLKVAYKYFEECKQVNFETLEVGNAAEQMLENELHRHLRMVNEEKIKRVLGEFNSNLTEIESTITSLSNCLSLLLPPAEEFFISECSLQKIHVPNNMSSCNNAGSSKDNSSVTVDENENNEDYLWGNKSNLRECGIPFDYNLSLELKIEDFQIDKTKENSTVIESARDCIKLINNRFLPMVKKWIKVYSTCGERLVMLLFVKTRNPNSFKNSKFQRMFFVFRNDGNIKKIIDLKEKLDNILKKYNSLHINEETSVNNETDSDDDDYEFEEVKKEGYEDTVDIPEELMLDCLKGVPDVRNSVAADASTSKDSSKALVDTSASGNNTGKPGSNSLLKPTLSILERKKKLPSVSREKINDLDFFYRKEENLPTCSFIHTKTEVTFLEGAVNNFQKIASPNGKPDLQTEVLTGLSVLGKRKKKRKIENKNLTHKKMKTSAAALKILESKNLPGLVDVVKRQKNVYTRLSKKLFSRSLKKNRFCSFE